MSKSHMPPIPPASRSPKGPGAKGRPGNPAEGPGKHGAVANESEQGETANIRENTTNKGFFAGRRVK